LFLILLAVLIAIIVAGFQYLYKNKAKSQLKYWLFALRFISVLSILIYLINPTLKKDEFNIEKPTLIVVVDNSKSIKNNGNDEKVSSFVDNVKTNKALNDKFDISYYSIGDNLKKNGALDFNDPISNLSKPLEAFSKVFQPNNTPLIFITDGNENIGKSIGFSSYKSPVFPFIVGDTTSIEDISIETVNANKYTYIKNKLPVEIFVNYNGNRNVAKKLNIYKSGKRIYSKNLKFSEVNNSIIETVYLDSEEEGVQFYNVSIEQLKNEVNKLNNNQNFSITVVDKKSKVLLLTETNHPDIGMFKRAIESSEEKEVTIKNVNEWNDNLRDFQLVILYQPTNSFEKVFNEVISKKINYFIISGLNTDWNFLNSIQQDFLKNNTNQPEKYFPIYDENNTAFLTEDIGFQSFPPLDDLFGDFKFNVPHQVLLKQRIGLIEINAPLLATFSNRITKKGILFGENSWRWRMESFRNKNSFEEFDSYFLNLVQYLSSTKNFNRLNVDIKSIYYSNETVKVTANILDENLNFDKNERLSLSIKNSVNGFTKNIPFSLFETNYQAEITNLPEGEYEYKVVSENQNQSILGKFKVLPFELEQQHLNSDDKNFKILSSKTNGAIFYENEENTLISSVLNDERFSAIQKSKTKNTPLINWYWLLFFTLISLSLEWFVRKYFGKI